MTKQDFLTAVRAHAEGCGFIPHELEKLLEYYSEMIDEAMEEGVSEEDAVAVLGTWSEIIGQINTACGIGAETGTDSTASANHIPDSTTKTEQTELPTAEVTSEPAPVRGYIRFPVWAVVLLILTSPVWASLALAAFIVLLSLIIVAGAVVITVLALTVGIAVAGVACIPAAFVLLYTTGGAAFSFTIGGGLLCIGIALLCGLMFRGLAWLFSGMMHFIFGGLRAIFY
ncbi:MAG: hypothetical protein IJ449_08935 [Clostridia bacterium]|nr:hypothetical protein [Clostridia bacterium]